MCQIGLKGFLWLRIAVPWTYVISNLNNEEIVGSFYKKELQKPNQKRFRVERVVKRKRDNLYFKRKG